MPFAPPHPLVNMPVREQVLVKLASKARILTAFASVACLYLLCIIPSFSNHAGVEEDTIYPGGTIPFVKPADVPREAESVAKACSRIGLPYFELPNDIQYTVVQSGRGDGREGLVYVFMGHQATSVGLTLANALSRVAWLSKDVYFLFVSTRKDIDEWLFDFYRSHQQTSRLTDKPILRGAFVLDLSAASGVKTSLFLEVEGVNGMLPNEDFGNVFFEVAQDAGLLVRVRSFYESVVFQAFNGGVHSPHTPFLNYAIPAITVRYDAGNKAVRVPGLSLLQISQVVGRHLRAISASHHQLHHSTSWYFYTGPSREVSMGLFLPVLLGLFSPVLVGVIDLNGHKEAPRYTISLVFHMVWGSVVLGGLTCLAIIAFAGGLEPGYCSGSVRDISLDPLGMCFAMLSVLGGFLHAYRNHRMNRVFDLDESNPSKCTSC